MKTKITLLILLLLSSIVFAQQGINYKAIIKDDLGNALADTFMNIQFTIHSVNETGTIVYQEDHNKSTDANGLLILTIGTDDTPSVGVFDNIDWSADQHFLQTSIIYGGGTIDFDATEFMAVPYALHAKTVENIDITGNETAFDGWDKDASDDFDGEYSSLSGTPNSTISIPSYAMSKPPTSTIITKVTRGLQWENNFANSTSIIIRKPENYNGEDVEFSIFFQTTSSASGEVQFFIRPRSYNSGDGLFDAASIVSDGTSVSGTIGFGSMYQQNITIPASRLSDDWWYITIQRNTSTYTDDVVVMSASLTY